MKKIVAFLVLIVIISNASFAQDRAKWNYFGSRILIHSGLHFNNWLPVGSGPGFGSPLINPNGSFGIRIITSRTTELNIDFGSSRFWYHPDFDAFYRDSTRLIRSQINPSKQADLMLSLRFYNFNAVENMKPYSDYFAPLGTYYKFSIGIIRAQIATNGYSPFFREQYDPPKTFIESNEVQSRALVAGFEVGREFPLSKKFICSTAFSFNLAVQTNAPEINDGYTWGVGYAIFDHNIWKATYRLSFAL